MKKKHVFDTGLTCILTKTMRIMRLSVFFSFLFITQSWAISGYSQQTRLSLNMNNVRVVDVMNEIEKGSEYFFFYTEKLVDVNRDVNIHVKDAKIEDILHTLFQNSDITYKVVDRQIILTKNHSENTSANEVEKSVTGEVTDSSGAVLPGVTIVVKGTTRGTVTNADGEYSLSSIPEDATLVFSFVGMKTLEVVVGSQTNINVTLEEEAIGIEEVVAIGYGTQKKGNLTGAVATVQSEDLIKAPIASTSNAITGRMPGVITKQGSGSPGQDDASISIRGFGVPLVIVDGVAGDFNNIDANEIESISVLKDASAAIYGARAGNGVILVTTKRGTAGKPRITLNSSYTSQSNTIFLEPVSSGQYAEMQRQKWHELGEIGAAPFSEADIAKYYRGDDPDYPNTNWFDEVMRPSSPMHQHNLSLSGGNENLKYFAFLGYLNQQSFLKSNDGKYNRYNVRANLDAKVTKDLSVQFDLSTIIGVRKYPWRGAHRGGEFFQDLWNQQPIYEAFTPSQGRYPYAGAETSIVPETIREGHGYQDDDNQNFKGSLAFLYSVPFLQGLSAKAFVNYSKDFNRQKLYERPYSMYTYNNKTDEYIHVSTLNNSVLTHRNAEYQEITGQFSLNYENTFGNHKVSALALYEFIDIYSTLLTAARGLFLVPDIDYLFGGNEESMTNYGSASETGRVSWIGRLNYSYKDKYLLESTIRRDASAKFAPDGRWGTFPSVSVGWRLSEENFIKNNFQAISNSRYALFWLLCCSVC